MFHIGVRRLVHGIVVVGAALGCSGQPAGSGMPGSAARLRECEHSEQFVCQDFGLFYSCITGGPCDAKEADNCHCDAERPLAASSCAAPQQFLCEAWLDDRPLGCRCDLSAPLEPSDCAASQQFHCASLEPRTGCACDPEAPLEAADCDARQTLQCQSYEPPIACRCIRPAY